MKLVILTSDILDGRIVAQTLLKAGREITAIIYEKKHKGLKTKIKLLLFFLFRRLEYLSFESMSRGNKGLLVKATDDINKKENIELLNRIKPDLIVVTGTRKLKREVFDSASKGAINLHSGILPFYRGADSEFWALYNNEPQNIGVTIHFIDEGLDSGEIILSERQRVKPKDSHSRLRKKNIDLGAKKINQTIGLIESGNCPRIKQNNYWARTYPPATKTDIAKLRYRRREWLRRPSSMKLFGNGSVRVKELVASRPLIESMAGLKIDYPGIFCLRIDADEYDQQAFDNYLNLFRRYKDAITIFINANSFFKARDRIRECRDMGLDIQSHGFYHYTYNDYRSNRFNIRRARIFFEDLGVQTKGFAAPMGRWNKHLMQALEDEGYEYSSDFGYDYFGLPTYPGLKGRLSGILEIPVFPVAPELFFRQACSGREEVLNYYQRAIDEMIDCAIPVIIYAHTASFKEVLPLLRDISEYAFSEKGLRPLSMTGFCRLWKEGFFHKQDPDAKRRAITVPHKSFLGERVNPPAAERLKNFIKNGVDFEKITPDDELCCSLPKRQIKILLRRLF